LTVQNVNDAPVISSNLPDLTFNEDSTYSYQVANWYPFVEDADDVDSDLIYSVKASLHVSVNYIAPNFIFQANDDWYGSETLELKVSDGLLTLCSLMCMCFL
jgi:hypothetical protein